MRIGIEDDMLILFGIDADVLRLWANIESAVYKDLKVRRWVAMGNGMDITRNLLRRVNCEYWVWTSFEVVNRQGLARPTTKTKLLGSPRC